MTLKVIGSGELVEQVFWLDTRSRTCGVKLRNPKTGYECCNAIRLADLLADSPHSNRPVNVELAIGDRAQVILREE